MSTPSSQLPSFSLVIHHADAPNVFVTMCWQPTNETTNTNTAPPPAVPSSQPQPAAPARRIYLTLKGALQSLGARLRIGRDAP
ncbi:hypothetical protein K438DRAFT_1957024 [Mycena galopus ATCC 62051]|nr:hypothetical protein K438DRAFT_1957024 [Mycena galopus ATCC 62051]